MSQTPNNKPARLPLRHPPTFFWEFLKHPLQIGSVIPSSRFLEQRLVKTAGIASARTIVELGAGTGGTTRAILRAMPLDARLLSIEINAHFYRLLKGIEDQRLIAHFGNACDLRELLSSCGLGAADAIISGIPFSTMSRSVGAEILATIASALSPKGRFVAYQVRDRIASLCEPSLGTPQVELELLNVPPIRVFAWEKPDVYAEAEPAAAASYLQWRPSEVMHSRQDGS
jgi:phosphatidylethanolamine/phosphatidyl-N-methylethanolamine N-methyltransferase